MSNNTKECRNGYTVTDLINDLIELCAENPEAQSYKVMSIDLYGDDDKVVEIIANGNLKTVDLFTLDSHPEVDVE